MTHRSMPVPEGLAGLRVDAGLARLLGLSRTVVATLAETGDVELDGVPVGKSDKLIAGAWLQVRLPAPPVPPQNTPVDIEGMAILYADDDIVAVDKPPWVAAHASVGWTGPTVLGGLAAAGYRISTSGVPERQGIVQRLDVGTSGVMVVARSERAYTVLKRAFKARTVDKRYHTLVQGHPDPSSGTIDAPIGRHHGRDWKFAVTAQGRASRTHYDTLEAFVAASLLDVELETGRTHQIRVHFAALHHPCCGDLTYGADPTLAKRLGLERQWLHAVSLAFAHPADGRRIEITSEYPPDLVHALDVLRAHCELRGLSAATPGSQADTLPFGEPARHLGPSLYSGDMADPLFDAIERKQLADLFDELGPDAPTLLEPWTTRDLASHLVLREHDYLAAPGLVLPGEWGRFAERRRTALAGKDFRWLVATIRSGPPRGFFRIHWVRNFPNLNEFFIHHEDVRRANGCGPRTNAPAMDAALWRNVCRAPWFLARRLRSAGLELEWAGTVNTVRARRGEPTVRLVGLPGEVLLFLFGRQDAARVEVTGPADAVEAVRRARFGM